MAINSFPRVTDVAIQDQHTEIINLYLFNHTGDFVLASGTVMDTNSFTVVSGHTISAGNIVCFKENTAFMQAMVTNVATNVISIDSPFDHAYTVDAICCNGSKELNVNGSVSPVIFQIGPHDLVDVSWDIDLISMVMTDNSPMDDALFGGITALAKGIVVRSKNGITKNIFNAKSNGDLKLQSDKYDYSSKAPSGSYGFSCTRYFNGREYDGVVVRLSSTTDDYIQIIIQDDLSALSSFNVLVRGQVVEDLPLEETSKIFDIGSAVWTAVTASGQSATCWLSGNVSEGAIMMDHSSNGMEGLDIRKGLELTRPRNNIDIMQLIPDNSADIYYARCIVPGATCKIIVDAIS